MCIGCAIMVNGTKVMWSFLSAFQTKAFMQKVSTLIAKIEFEYFLSLYSILDASEGKLQLFLPILWNLFHQTPFWSDDMLNKQMSKIITGCKMHFYLLCSIQNTRVEENLCIVRLSWVVEEKAMPTGFLLRKHNTNNNCI